MAKYYWIRVGKGSQGEIWLKMSHKTGLPVLTLKVKRVKGYINGLPKYEARLYDRKGRLVKKIVRGGRLNAVKAGKGLKAY